jgi:hypothetical protein
MNNSFIIFDIDYSLILNRSRSSGKSGVGVGGLLLPKFKKILNPKFIHPKN